jgi:membrane-associated protease RseP (regulator of RpoE activity)
MATKRSFSLVQAVLLALLFLTPLMLLLGTTEGTTAVPGLLFWLLLVVPLLLVGWLLTCYSPEDTADGHRALAGGLGDRGEDDLATGASVQHLVAPEVDVSRTYRDGGLLVAEGELQVPSQHAFAALERRLLGSRAIPLLESLGGRAVRVLFLPRPVDERLRQRRSVRPNLLLFLATLATTIHAGALHQGVSLLTAPQEWAVGLPYAVALLGVLGVHEMGHYVVARRHGVAVTLPYFIPVPMGLGTFGAFIQMRSLIRSRRAVFDIGIAGPLAGMVVAIPALYFGLHDSEIVADASSRTGLETGSSILLALLYQAVHGGPLGGDAVRLSPVAFAGWVGLFVTALNLLPVGQLDGGHIAYGLFGRRHARTISVGAVVAMLVLGLFVWPGLLTWAVLVTLLAGFTHMPALDDVTRPNAVRFALGALAFVILALIVVPVPDELRLLLDSPYQ